MRIILLLPCAVGVLLTTACAVSAHAQTRPEVITGRVVTDSGAAVAGAEAIVTMAPNREVFRDTTDVDGRFRIEIAGGTGDYLVYVAAIGRRPFRKRITRESLGAGTNVFIVDVTLSPNVAQLAAVRVQAQPQRPTRTSDFTAEVGGAERIVDGVTGAVAPHQVGDLAAIASTVPGVFDTGTGVSFLGLDPSQNRTSINGMSFSGGDVPRDVGTRTRVYTGTYDPARGGFSGGEIAVEVAPGETFNSRRARLTLDARALQTPDPFGRGVDQRLNRIHTSIGGSGPLGESRLHYNYGVDLRRSASDAPSLQHAGADALRVAGVASDSVARLLSLLTSRGIPVTTGEAADRVSTEMTMLTRFDYGRFKPNTLLPSDHTFSLTAYARVARSDRAWSSLTSTPASSGAQHAATGMLQGALSSYFGPGKLWLNDLRSAVSVRADEDVPYLTIPVGQVLVASGFDDDSNALTHLAFGGSVGGERQTRGWTWETVDDVQFHPGGKARHRVKAHISSRLERLAQEFGDDRGRFAFNSISDFAADSPASYSRSLGERRRESGAWNGALAIGDFYRRSPQFQLLYGVRLEGSVLQGRPVYNPMLDRELGVRNDAVPNRLHVSPRLGFTWVVGQGATSYGVSASPLAQLYIGPKGVIRGGVGEFRNAMPATLLGEAHANTGMGGMRRVSCVGAAVPVPRWDQYVAGTPAPAECADGAPGLVDAAPYVMLFDPDYDAPRSWRANLSWSATTLAKRLDYTVDAIYSLNLDQSGTRDLNFAGDAHFVLGDEGRPVFVRSSSIVPSTGAVSPADARRSDAFGRVASRHSDLRSVSRQVTVALTPVLGIGRYFVRGAYTLAETRAMASGFDGAAFGDPREQEWGRGPYDARHQLQLQLGFGRPWGSMTAFIGARSGMPYTPIVRGDVNGDGAGGDRAFVHNPSSIPDPLFAEGLRTLLESGSPRARDCLVPQVGRPAMRNGCEGPWTTSMNAQISLATSVTRRLLRTNRASISINLANPLGGIDQLLHGRNLRGWGTPQVADPVLYTVRGFDPVAQQFRYAVNPRFGTADPARSLARAPFRLTIDARFSLGRPIPEQQLDRWLRPGRAGDKRPKLSTDSLKARYARNLPDMYRAVLSLSDSLLLTPDQVRALDSANASWKVRLDSIWTDLAVYMAAVPDSYDSKKVLAHQEAMLDRAWEALRLEAHRVLPDVLNRVQLRLLPYPANMLLNSDRPFGPGNRRRLFSG